MEIKDILAKTDKAISILLENENDILERGLKELNISTSLYKYLTPLFEDYTVDAEYNGDKLKPNDRKSLDMARNRMLEIGINPNDTDNYQLTPDIIIHKRNTNEHNLIVIEVKKDSNSEKNMEFDLLKLEHLTIDYYGNHYNYKLGIFIEFGTKKDAEKYNIMYFQNGIAIDKDKLE